jgi:hypothetical protein
MKYKLNLNEPGSKLFGIAGILLIISPALYGLAWMLNRFGIPAAWLKSLAGVTAGIGALLLLVLGVLLIIEALQDRAMEVSYHKQRCVRLPVGNGYYECQYCGCRRVKEEDRACPVCGRELDKAGESARS